MTWMPFRTMMQGRKALIFLWNKQNIAVLTQKYSYFDTCSLPLVKWEVNNLSMSTLCFLSLFCFWVFFCSKATVVELTVTEPCTTCHLVWWKNKSSLSLDQRSKLAPLAAPIAQSRPSQGVSSSSMEARRWAAIHTRPNLPVTQKTMFAGFLGGGCTEEFQRSLFYKGPLHSL